MEARSDTNLDVMLQHLLGTLSSCALSLWHIMLRDRSYVLDISLEARLDTMLKAVLRDPCDAMDLHTAPPG